MRAIISVATIFALVVTIGITISEAQEGQKRYTAYNIWRTSKMKCINFKQIRIGLDKHILKKGANEIKIIAGSRQGNYDDFQIHKIIVRYKG